MRFSFKCCIRGRSFDILVAVNLNIFTSFIKLVNQNLCIDSLLSYTVNEKKKYITYKHSVQSIENVFKSTSYNFPFY